MEILWNVGLEMNSYKNAKVYIIALEGSTDRKFTKAKLQKNEKYNVQFHILQKILILAKM